MSKCPCQNLEKWPSWNFFDGAPLQSFFHHYYWPKRCLYVQYEQNWRMCFWEKSTFLYTLFWPKMAIFWPRGTNFGPKTQKHSVTSCYDPFHYISELKLVSERKWQFWGWQTPQNPPMAPQTPPGVRGAQKWLSYTCTSPVLIFSDKKRILEGVNILTYFFTRNVPVGEFKPDMKAFQFPLQSVFYQTAGCPHLQWVSLRYAVSFSRWQQVLFLKAQTEALLRFNL